MPHTTTIAQSTNLSNDVVIAIQTPEGEKEFTIFGGYAWIPCINGLYHHDDLRKEIHTILFHQGHGNRQNYINAFDHTWDTPNTFIKEGKYVARHKTNQ